MLTGAYSCNPGNYTEATGASYSNACHPEISAAKSDPEAATPIQTSIPSSASSAGHYIPFYQGILIEILFTMCHARPDIPEKSL